MAQPAGQSPGVEGAGAGGCGAHGDRGKKRCGGMSSAAKIRKRVDWLNSHVLLAGELLFDEIACSLLDIDVRQAMGVLRRLEAMAGAVREPNGFVIGLARRACGNAPVRGRGRCSKRGGLGVTSGPVPPAAPSMTEVSEQRGCRERAARLQRLLAAA